jgi:hypothetical protein
MQLSHEINGFDQTCHFPVTGCETARQFCVKFCKFAAFIDYCHLCDAKLCPNRASQENAAPDQAAGPDLALRVGE